jgi:hypothetical protein
MTANGRIRLTDPAVPFPSAGNGRSVSGSGIFGTASVVLTTLLGAVLFVGALVLITAVFLAAVLAALCVVAIRGAVHALAPRHTQHPDQGGFRPAAVIDTTAKVIRSTARKPRPGTRALADGGGTGGEGPIRWS